MKYCHPDCPYLHPTEAQQDLFFKMYHFKPFHVCKKYKMNGTMRHQGHHPKLPRHDNCDMSFPEEKTIIKSFEIMKYKNFYEWLKNSEFNTCTGRENNLMLNAWNAGINGCSEAKNAVH